MKKIVLFTLLIINAISALAQESQSIIPTYGIQSNHPDHLCYNDPECFFGPYCIGDEFEFQAYQPAYENAEVGSYEETDILFTITFPSGIQLYFDGFYVDVFSFVLIEPGTYTIDLDAEQNTQVSYTFNILVYDEPTDFSISPNPVFAGGLVDFSVDADSDFCFWDIGEADVNYSNSFSEYFLNPGEYEVELEVNYETCEAVFNDVLVVLENDPQIVAPTYLCVGECYDFIGTCPDESVIYQWVWGGEGILDSYSQNQVLCFEEPGEYSISLTTFGEGLASWQPPQFSNTLIGTTSIDIVVVEPPQAPLINGSELNCEDHNLYEVENPNSIYEYQWIVTGGEIIDYNTNSVLVDWDEQSVFSGNSELSLISVDTLSECQALTTIEIDLCCNATSELILVNGDTDEIFSDVISDGGIVYFQTISIDGIVYFNNDIIFQECDILMGPNASIIVGNNSTLRIEKNSHVYSCEGLQMWDEIRVLDGSNIIVQNSIFEDGTTAIRCSPGSTYSILNSQFLNNYTSVSIKGDGGMSNTIRGSVFEVYNNLLAPFEWKDKGHIGVQYIGVPYAILGHPLWEDSENEFSNLDFGVVSEKSKLLVCDNVFMEIKSGGSSEYYESLLSGNESEPGIAIYSEGGVGENMLVVGSVIPDKTNTFFKCRVGVEAYSKQNLTVIYNEFEECSFGVRFEKNSDSFIDVSNNYLHKIYNTGIMGLYADGVNLTIDNNYMNVVVLRGISLSAINDAFNSNMPAVISNNCLVFVLGGIEVVESSNIDVLDNKIEDLFYVGISLEGGNNHLVHENYIDKGDTIYSTILDNEIGIRVSDCIYSKITCNEIRNTNVGAHYLMNSKGRFLHNKMIDSNFGIHLSNNGVMGQQGNPEYASANVWDGIVFDDISTSDDTEGSLSTFYVFGGELFQPTVSGDDQVLIEQSLAQGNLSCVYSHFCEDTLELVQFPQASLIEEMSLLESAILSNNNSTDEIEFIKSQSLYEIITKDTMLIEYSPILNSFKSEMENNCEGKLVKVKDCLHAKNVNQLLEAEQILNSDLSTENLADQSGKELYTVLVNFLQEGKSLSNIDDDTRDFIESIAWMCPAVEGNSVYRARSVMNYINTEAVLYFNNCEMPINSFGHSRSVEGLTSSEVKIFPNPSNGEFEIKSIIEVVNVSIFDQAGREIKYSCIEKEEGLLVKVSNSKSGVYTVVCNLEDGGVSSNLIIIKQ